MYTPHYSPTLFFSSSEKNLEAKQNYPESKNMFLIGGFSLRDGK